jgi:hypothetical protein
MNINWVLANSAQIDPMVEVSKLKELGSFWGGWRTWRACQTDNVICNDQIKCDELLKRNFHRSCNFYIPNSVYLNLGRPEGVKLYEGMFVHEVDNQEDIISMHLAASNSDIVLLLGFDFSDQSRFEDKLIEHRAHNYRSLTKQVIVNNQNTQWVVLDHPAEFRKDLQTLPNLGRDNLINILQV